MAGDIEIFSTLTCPACGYQAEFQMPLHARKKFFQCANCHSHFESNKDKCCIFCSYGSVPCPNAQMKKILGIQDIELFSTLTCPNCGHHTEFQMPVHASKKFFECPHCKTSFSSKEDECCIFCTFGSVRCPATQLKLRQESQTKT
jgi:hypothetical protein